MMSMVIFFGLIALLVLELEYAACADPLPPQTFDVKVYPVGRWVNNLTVFWDKRTWLEAYESCISKNLIFHQGWKGTSFHDFVLAHALKENRSDFEGLWIGDYRPEGSSNWYWTNGCGPYNSGPDVIGSTDGTLCNLLNATAPMEANVYAISCTQRHAYICSESVGYYKDVEDSYILHNNSQMFDESSFWRAKIVSDITLEDCIFELFGTVGVIAEFRDITNDRGTCEMFAYHAHELPLTVTLVDTTEEIITITGIKRLVLFDEYEDGITTDGYPCSVNLPTEQTDTITTYDTESTTKSIVFSTNMYEILTQTDKVTNQNSQGVDQTTNSITEIGSTVPLNVYCLSVCHCSGTINMTAEELQEILKNIRMVLKIDTKELSSNRRKKISAPDERLLSRSMGYVAVIVLVFIGSVIIISDLSNLSMYKSEKYEMK